MAGSIFAVDLEFRNLPIKVSGHDALAQQFHTVHLGLETAPAVIPAPSSPYGATQVSRCVDRFVSGDGSCTSWLPRLGVLARRNDSIGIPGSNGVMAFARVIGAVGSDRTNVLIGRDLIEQFGQHGRVTDVADGDLDSSDF